MRTPRLASSFARLSAVGSVLAVMLSVMLAHGSELRRTAIVKAVQGVRYSVVNIHGHKTVPAGDRPELEPERQVNGMGTGVVIDRRGYILTNYHVVDGVARIQVTDADGGTTIGQLIARDRATDLAIIKIPTKDKLKVINFGTSSDLMVAEPVVAVGNAYGYNHSVTRGIVSALHRDVPISETQQYFDLIQTDASINPGNSGGPLLNIDGQMIGLNVAVRVGAQGIGFAIPVDQALEIAAQMIAAHGQNRHWHGMVGETKFRQTEATLHVASVEAGSPAEAAGVEAGDVISAVGTTPVRRRLDFELALLEFPAGQQVKLQTERQQQAHRRELVLAQRPKRGLMDTISRVWSVTGVRLSPVPQTELERRGSSSPYRGGLRITAVRPGSPAERQNVQPGDILVGMHVWETVTLENVGYVMNQSEIDRTRPVKCFILRDNRTHYTYLPVGTSVR